MRGGNGVLSPAKQAELLKKDGNSYFKKDRIGAAIDAYTEAITLCPNVPVYLTNRALCHRKRKDWLKVEEDCRKAILLDNSCVKVFKGLPSSARAFAPNIAPSLKYLSS
uniref:RING-type E3 ubiquitin transferase n=1 Tax=Quercus lobata TaxID=97700 RepID=A0A7N2MLT8_QUELO